MALQLARWLTFVNNVSQIDENFLNPLQDELIHLNEQIDDETTTFLGCSGDGVGATFGLDDGSIVATEPQKFIVPVTLQAGAIMSSCIVHCSSAGGVNGGYALVRRNLLTGAESVISSVAIVNGARAATELIFVDETVLATESYYVRSNGTAGTTDTLFMVEVRWNRDN